MAAKKRSAKSTKKASSKKQAKKPKTKAAAPKTRAAASSSSVGASSATSTVELLTDLPRLTDAERAAFRAQFTDAQCSQLGDRTKSAAVHKDGFAWAKIMLEALRAHPLPLRRYGVTRLAWFVECLRALESAIAEQASTRSASADAGLGVDLARTAAMAVRNDLRDTLHILAGADDRHKQAVHDAMSARDGAGDDAQLAGSLHALADLADKWLGRGDDASKALVTSVSLSRGDVDAARMAADELDRALGAEAGRSHDATHDAPATNLAEGRVLAEMRLAMSVFARAHESNRAVPNLVPGPGTRQVLAGHPRAKAKGSDGASKEKPAPSDGGKPSAPAKDAPSPPA